jgi:hypothetical protein
MITYRRAGKINNEKSGFILIYMCLCKKYTTDIRAPFCRNDGKQRVGEEEWKEITIGRKEGRSKE